jgi:hypothetical protein
MKRIANRLSKWLMRIVVVGVVAVMLIALVPASSTPVAAWMLPDPRFVDGHWNLAEVPGSHLNQVYWQVVSVGQTLGWDNWISRLLTQHIDELMRGNVWADDYSQEWAKKNPQERVATWRQFFEAAGSAIPPANWGDFCQAAFGNTPPLWLEWILNKLLPPAKLDLDAPAYMSVSSELLENLFSSLEWQALWATMPPYLWSLKPAVESTLKDLARTFGNIYLAIKHPDFSLYHLYEPEEWFQELLGYEGNAVSRAEFWYQEALKAFQEHGTASFPDPYMENDVMDYHDVTAYDYLGRALHYLQDMAQPAHSKDTYRHLFDLEYYEIWSSKNTYPESAVIWTGWPDELTGGDFAEMTRQTIDGFVKHWEDLGGGFFVSIELPWRPQDSYLMESKASFMWPSIYCGGAMLIQFHNQIEELPEPEPYTPSVDVFMLVDLTGSFYDDLPAFKAQAPDLIATLKSQYPDIRFGLGKFEDYPIWPFGNAAWGDKAYQRLVDLTFDANAVLNTIAGLYTRDGVDGSESQLAALYQAATGGGQDLSGVGYPGASIPAGQQANFRDGATKLILLWTDADFHHPGDPGNIPYPGPSFDETVDAILALDPPMVIGISSGGGGLTDLEAIAAATGALAPPGGIDTNGDGIIDIPEGEPLVATIGYSGQGIAAAIESLVEGATVLPIADASGPYSGEVGEPIVFDGSHSFDPDGWIVLYEWNFDSDGVFDFSSAGPIAEHAYTSEFSGVVTLRVTDNEANVRTDTSPVEVSVPANLPPVANAGPDQVVERTSAAGAEVTLNGSASFDPDGNPLTYAWSWAGGGLASGVSPAVVMPMGTTVVTLEVSDGALNDTGTVSITVQDTTPPTVTVEFPTASLAVQDGITLKASASDLSSVAAVYFYVRELDGAQGEVISPEFEDLSATFNSSTSKWEYNFDTLKLPDGNYLVLAKAVDAYDNEGWSACVPFSIRNWAVITLLPSTPNSNAGRTMPVKFALRVSASVDPARPFIYNDELTIKIFATSNPGVILQTSIFGSGSRNYRIQDNTLYITNFQTSKVPMQYTVEIWRTSKNWLVGTFTFKTVK